MTTRTVCPEVEKTKMDNFLLFNIWGIYLVENTLNYHKKKKKILSLVLFEQIEFMYTDFPILYTRFDLIWHKCV